MRIAILSDIHSNLEALLACLAHARFQGAEQFVFLGDLLGKILTGGTNDLVQLDVFLA